MFRDYWRRFRRLFIGLIRALLIVIRSPFLALAAAVAFLTVWKKRWLPYKASPEALARDMPPLTIWTLNHHLVNRAVEAVRADPQWWTKFFWFVIAFLSVVCVQLIVQ